MYARCTLGGPLHWALFHRSTEYWLSLSPLPFDQRSGGPQAMCMARQVCMAALRRSGSTRPTTRRPVRRAAVRSQAIEAS